MTARQYLVLREMLKQCRKAYAHGLADARASSDTGKPEPKGREQIEREYIAILHEIGASPETIQRVQDAVTVARASADTGKPE